MVKYLLFDIDDTLFPSAEFSALARKNALNAMIGMGLDCDYETAAKKLSAIIEKKGPNYQGHFNDLCQGLAIAEPGRYIAAAVAAYHDTKTSIAPFPKVPHTLLRLRESGYRLFIATQGISIKQWDKLIRLRIALYFEGVFVSEEMKEDKGPAFYRKVLHALNARAEDCMMVGDREDTDILPAKEVGMKTVRVLYGKQANLPTKADFAIKDVSELIPILRDL